MRVLIKQILYLLKRPYHFFRTGLWGGFLPQLKAGFPQNKLKIIAITGTDGKTTSSFLTYHLLKTAGKKVALVTTVAAYIGDEQLNTGFHVTSPHPKQLTQLMARMVAENYEYLVLETTSHGIYQFRTWGIKPLIAAVTNITHEHTDYHLTYSNYVSAKAEILQKADWAIINADDASFTSLKKILYRHPRLLTYSQQDKLPPKLTTALREKFPQDYNQMNARIAILVGKILDLPESSTLEALETFTGVPGRLEFVKTRKHFDVVIDFAHTPNSLAKVLTYLKKYLKKQAGSGKLIAVFGCAGHRDISKRPIMGKIASQIADLAIFTAEDPRQEDIWSIIRQMKEDPDLEHRKILSIPDRMAAIRFAIQSLARPGDVVAVLGKGHETSMCIGKVEYPWSDAKAIREVLNEK